MIFLISHLIGKLKKGQPIPPEIKVSECKTQQEFDQEKDATLNSSFKSKKDHLSFNLISGQQGNYLVMTFDHKLFDARGAEIFLNLLAGNKNHDISDLLAQIKTVDSPKLKDWNKKFEAGKDIQRHLMDLSKKQYVALSKHSMNNPPVKDGPNLTSKTTIFSTKETDKILEKSEKLAGFMMETPFLLAIASLAIHEITSPGFKYNMTDIAAAIGVNQLKRADGFYADRKRIAEKFSELMAGIDGVTLPVEREDVKHSWHLFVIRVDEKVCGISRNSFIEKLTDVGIGTSVHYLPLHMHPYYIENFGYKPDDFPVAHKLFNQVISLPIYPGLTDVQIERISDTVRKLAIRG